MSEAIKLENVIRMIRNNFRTVNGMSLCVQERERVLICGGFGSGRGELMRLIAGMDQPSAGSIVVLNQAVHAMSADEAARFRNRNIGIVEHEPGFMEGLNVAENISLPLIVRGVRRDHRGKAVEDLMELLKIRHVAHAYPAQLSTYEARLACIARALITKPQILMFNEITALLSEREAKKIIDTISAIPQSDEYTILCFADGINNTLHMNRTIQLKSGKIYEDSI